MAINAATVVKTGLKFVYHPNYWHPSLGSQPLGVDVAHGEAVALSGAMTFPLYECFATKAEADAERNRDRLITGLA